MSGNDNTCMAPQSKREITGKTQVFGILGDPVTHSLSPALHNACLREKNIDAVYVPLGGPFDDSSALKSALRGLGVGGVSVTIPHKKLAFAAADEHDPVSQIAGSANTLKWDSDRQILRSWNTDGPGALEAILDTGGLASALKKNRGQKIPVVLFGNGGTTLGILAGLTRQDWVASVQIWGRNGQKVANFLEDFQNRVKASPPHWPLSGGVLPDSNRRTDWVFDKKAVVAPPGGAGPVLWINTTPIGMNQKASDAPFPLPAECLGKYDYVFDAVYTPLETDLVLKARAVGAVVVPGYEMLLFQGLEQMKIFYDLRARPSAASYREILLRHLGL